MRNFLFIFILLALSVLATSAYAVGITVISADGRLAPGGDSVDS